MLSVTLRKFVCTIKNPLDDLNFSITDIKSNKAKPYRILISYKNIINESSAVILYSINKDKEISRLLFQPSFY